MGTKNNPGEFDCYAAADPDEEMFILLARDETAPERVRAWALKRRIAASLLTGRDRQRATQKASEAFRCADRMEAQYEKIREALRRGVTLADLNKIQIGPTDV